MEILARLQAFSEPRHAAIYALGDQVLDLIGRAGAVLRKVSHLTGRHGKAVALFAGTTTMVEV